MGWLEGLSLEFQPWQLTKDQIISTVQIHRQGESNIVHEFDPPFVVPETGTYYFRFVQGKPTFSDKPPLYNEITGGGAWVVYDYNVGAYPIALFSTETEAGRKVNDLGYGRYRFWEFGTEWSD